MPTLVTFFSRAGQNYTDRGIVDLPHGNAEVLAGYAADAANADLFRIEPVQPYPADYHRCTDVAAQEKASGARPALSRDIDIEPYERIILIYPNWWGTLPMPVYTFLEAHDWSGKTILPLCTHEGSGLSATERDIERTCPNATVLPGLAVRGSVAADAQGVVRTWIEQSTARATQLDIAN